MQASNKNNARGIDISHYQGEIDFEKVKASGIEFVFMKSTQGTNMIDSMFETNYKKAKAAGLKVGFYHFLTPKDNEDALAEADFFLNTIEDYQNDLPHALDLEQDNGLNRDQMTLIAKTWLQYVEVKTNRKPLVYSYPSFLQLKIVPGVLTDYPLWLAYWNSDPHPPDYAGWKKWVFIQYSNKGTIPGINGDVDLNEMEGDFNEILRVEDANKIISTFLQPIWDFVSSQEEKDEIHRLANEMRKVSGQPIRD